MDNVKMKKCKMCKKEFTPFNSLQNVCSPQCQEEKKRLKQSRKPMTFAKVPKVDISKLFGWDAARKAFMKNFLLKHSYLFCENCSDASGMSGWEVHHIIFRSQLRKHPDVHNERNLVLLCGDCHYKCHHHRPTRLKWIRIRKLWEIYDVAKKYKQDS